MKPLREAITEHTFFRSMKPEHLAVLMEGATTKQFKADEILFRQGEPANQYYLVESGQIALETHVPPQGALLVQVLRGGDVLGWSWLFPPFVWHLQARAVEPTEVIILNGAHLLIAAESNHDFGYELMKRVAQVVICRLQAARKQLIDLQLASGTQR